MLTSRMEPLHEQDAQRALDYEGLLFSGPVQISFVEMRKGLRLTAD